MIYLTTQLTHYWWHGKGEERIREVAYIRDKPRRMWKHTTGENQQKKKKKKKKKEAETKKQSR